ncbi:MAG: biopolymer transporter ExbD, partial [Candidatus Riflebacteria bacterium]|nr:biopolymer transporter ExbD [Candidatus Riflebacteria bacterium]
MRLSRKNNRENFSLDMTTCSDIIFTLLIFYILTQSFVTQVPLSLPELKSDMQNLSEVPNQIEISATGQISWNKEVLATKWEQSLNEKLTGIATDSSFLVMAHRQA